VAVVAIREDGAAAMKELVEAAGDPDPEALHAAAERTRVFGFDDQMEMIVLHREVDDAEVCSRESGFLDRIANYTKRLLGAQMPRSRERSKGDVDWETRGMVRALPMADVRSLAFLGASAGSFAPPPETFLQREVQLSPLHHLIGADIL
jgi:hypothetical protein